MAELLTIGDATVKRRHPFGPLGLSIITFGIYGIFWWYFINREMRDLGQKVEPFLSVLAITIGWLIIVPPFVSAYNTAARVQRVQQAAGLEVTDPTAGAMMPWLVLILWFVPFGVLLWQAYLQWGLNLAYDRWVGAGYSAALPAS
jgi:hypothetical protein